MRRGRPVKNPDGRVARYGGRWVAYIRVGGRTLFKESADREVCQRWLDEAPFAPDAPRWAVTAETNPHTAAYHLFLHKDWPRIGRVILTDGMNRNVPIAWVADDNGGRGWTEAGARRRAAAMPPLEGVGYRARPLGEIDRMNRKTKGLWQHE